MKRAIAALLSAAAALFAMSAALPATSSAAPRAPMSTAPADPVVEWNRFVLDLQAAPGNQPATVHPTYELAIVHAAISDAVVAVDRGPRPYLAHVRGARRASRAAAADAAAHEALVHLYPGLQPAIDDEYASQLSRVPSGRRRTQGVRVGELVADRILARRANDGSGAAPLPFVPGTGPGDYQLTPPAFAPPAFAHWSRVEPFALRRADQFRPTPPPALTSAKYAAAINEVKALGVAQG